MANKRDHNAQMEREMAGIPKGTPLLLHACCGPCASVALERLCGHFDVTVYYYNPNIAPRAEWERRLEALETLVAQLPAELPPRLIVGDYIPGRFAAATAGLEGEPEGGARCGVCFGLRLGEAARQAKALGIGWVATTLSTGPRKSAELIWRAGTAAAEANGVRFLTADFKKKEGYKRSIELCRQYGLYRQSFCGCRVRSTSDGKLR